MNSPIRPGMGLRCFVFSLAILLAGLTALAEEPATGNDPAKDADNEKSGAGPSESFELLQIRLQEAVRRRPDLVRELERADATLTNVKKSRDAMVAAHAKFSWQDLEVSLKELVTGTEKLAAEMLLANPSPNRQALIDAFQESYAKFERASFDVIDDPIDWNDSSIADDYLAPRRTELDGTAQWRGEIDKFFFLIRRVSTQTSPLSDVQQSTIRVVLKIGDRATFPSLRSSQEREMKDSVDRMSRRVASAEELKNKVKSALDRLDKEITSLNASLVAYGAKSSYKRDDFLLWIAIVMLAGLPLMFCLLWLFQEPTRSYLIDNRTMLELVGLVYLLVAVLLLLTGDKLNKESGATLLGGIAGYIFARRGNTTSPPPPQVSPVTSPTGQVSTVTSPGQVSIVTSPAGTAASTVTPGAQNPGTATKPAVQGEAGKPVVAGTQAAAAPVQGTDTTLPVQPNAEGRRGDILGHS